jgi:acetyltransferase-like isoleucine patch superfamily enzyme
MTGPASQGKARIHPTAIVEDGVVIGPETSVWDNVHIRKGARVGRRCIIGEKSYVAYDVAIGDFVKINAVVYICAGVTIADGVMISAHTVFTNDRFPRATDPDLVDLLSSAPNEDTLNTTVQRGVTIGAGCVIGPGITLGEWSMIGMGSVVTRSVAPHNLVLGNPARVRGLVCRCGHPVLKLREGQIVPPRGTFPCERCGRSIDASTCVEPSP